VTYTDDNVPLMETDLAILSKTKPSEANKLLYDGISSFPSCDSGLDASLAPLDQPPKLAQRKPNLMASQNHYPRNWL
jgi:hypothetical protein